jgi:hypothetical protein
MPRPVKKQINIKMPESLIEALKERAEGEDTTFTDLVVEACEQLLGGRSYRTIPAISPSQVDKRIDAQLAPLQEKIAELEAALGESVA